MKLYISADIEGLPGIQNWDECRKNHASWSAFAEQMTEMVRLVCKVAFDVGAEEIWVKDAHSSGLNIDHSVLPRRTRLIRGWSGHPYSMVQDIDSSFDAVLFLGYHSAAGSSGNPLAHTMSTRLSGMRLNGKRCSEFLLYGSLASALGVPTALVLGDRALCQHVKEHQPSIVTVESGHGLGDSMVGRHPDDVWEELQNSATLALNQSSWGMLPVADEYVLEMEYHAPQRAYNFSFFPGAEQIDERTLRFLASSMDEVVTAVKFLT